MLLFPYHLFLFKSNTSFIQVNSNQSFILSPMTIFYFIFMIDRFISIIIIYMNHNQPLINIHMSNPSSLISNLCAPSNVWRRKKHSKILDALPKDHTDSYLKQNLLKLISLIIINLPITLIIYFIKEKNRVKLRTTEVIS